MTKIKRYAILTPFANAQVLAGIAAVQKLDVDVVLTKSGALLVREMAVPQYDEWDIRNITGPDASDLEAAGDGDPSDNAPAVAAFLSRLSQYGVVLIDVDLGDEGGFEAGVSGVVRARRYQAGKPGEEIPGGLLLNALDPVIERVVLGETKPSQLGAIKSSELTASDLAELAGGAARSSEGDAESDGEATSDDDTTSDDDAETAPDSPKRGLFGWRRKGSEEES